MKKGYRIGFFVGILAATATIFVFLQEISVQTMFAPSNTIKIQSGHTTATEQCIQKKCHLGDTDYDQCLIDCATKQ